VSQTTAVTTGDDDAVNQERVAVELGRRTVHSSVVPPLLGAVVTVQRQEEAGARTEQDEIARDRGRRVDSAVGVEGPQDGIVLSTGIQRSGCPNRHPNGEHEN